MTGPLSRVGSEARRKKPSIEGLDGPLARWAEGTRCNIPGGGGREWGSGTYPNPFFPRETTIFSPVIYFAPIGISDLAFGSRSDLRCVPTQRTYQLLKCFFIRFWSPGVPVAQKLLDFPSDFPRNFSPRFFPAIFPRKFPRDFSREISP